MLLIAENMPAISSIWHSAVEPGDAAEPVAALFVAAVKAGLQLVDDC